MEKYSFDSYAEKYDAWFLENRNVLYSEVKLVAYFLKDAGRILSVGCGSGLFEMILEKEFDIIIKDGIEPSADMAEIARKRGLSVEIGTAEDMQVETGLYDTILYNGCPSYISDLAKSIKNSYDALKEGGRIILIDIPKESSYGLLYNLAKATGTWAHELLNGVYPRNPYPIELVCQSNWRTTAEKITLLESAGFSNLEFAQTLTKHPIYSNHAVEEPVAGYDSGDYVAICGYKRK
ncbi:MAG: class I SAM-dependent methyltransferase [Tannerella sp.]|jgi:SAM-dependent methyltransferase|nr:class I SAM-dependent methyltransferase [Tannerella sp.]